MRELGIVVVLCSLAACREMPAPSLEERTALYLPVLEMGDSLEAGNPRAADSLADVWLAERRPGPRDPPRYVDTLTAYVLARQAHAQRLAGDTARTVQTYRRLLPYRHLLPDSTAARVLRAMAWRIGATREGLELMDAAEAWARERGLNREAAQIMRCKADLVERMEGRDIAPAAPDEPRREGPAGLLLWVAAALLALEILWWFYRTRARVVYLYPARRWG